MKKWLVLIILALMAGGGFGIYRLIREPLSAVNANWLTPISSDSDVGINDFLGFGKPVNILVLFLNNTELRPGGGFIGSYAVVQVDKGRPQIIKIEGSEILDNQATSSSWLAPPAPIQQYLKTDRWFFRDSNWSPDFAESAQQTLSLFRAENGAVASEIDLVVGITPTVIEEMLKIAGPVKFGSSTYDAANFTEQLEYEVEYGYDQKNISFIERKKIIGDLAAAVMGKIKSQLIWHGKDFWNLAQRLLREKQKPNEKRIRRRRL